MQTGDSQDDQIKFPQTKIPISHLQERKDIREVRLKHVHPQPHQQHTKRKKNVYIEMEGYF